MRSLIFVAILTIGISVADTSRAADSNAGVPLSADDALRDPVPVPDLPACDSKAAMKSVKDTLANNAFKKNVTLQVLDYDHLSEVAFDAKDGVRVCIGDFVLNIGSQTISYTFRQAKSDPSQVLVQVQALGVIEAYQMRAEAEQHNETPEQKAQEAAPAPACDSQDVRLDLSKITPQDLSLQAGINHMQYQLGWVGNSRHFELGSGYKEESFDARDNQRECIVSINVCFHLPAGDNCGSTQAHYYVRKLGQEIIVHYSPGVDLEFTPSSAGK